MPDEPRIPRLAAEETTPEMGAIFEAFMRERGVVPNLFRVVAHQPAIGRTLHAHMQAVMGAGAVQPLLKELLAVRVSQINNCEY